MAANDLLIFEFAGADDGEVSISTAALADLVTAFLSIVRVTQGLREAPFELRVVLAEQGSLRIHLRAVAKFVHDNRKTMADYAAPLSLALATLVFFGFGVPVGAGPGPAEEAEKTQAAKEACGRFQGRVAEADAGPLTIITPDGEAVQLVPHRLATGQIEGLDGVQKEELIRIAPDMPEIVQIRIKPEPKYDMEASSKYTATLKFHPSVSQKDTDRIISDLRATIDRSLGVKRS